jgi:hypothetical protein
MKVVTREGNTLKFAVAELEHPQMKYRNIEVHAVPIIGRAGYYDHLRSYLLTQKTAYGRGAAILNSTVEDDFTGDSDSTRLGNGYWSDIAHIYGHRVLDESIPLKEYTQANLNASEILPLLHRRKDKHVKSKEKANRIFEDFELNYQTRKNMAFALGQILRYKYSSFCFGWSEFMYPQAYKRIAERTTDVVRSLHSEVESVHILVDPYAFNTTVKHLKGLGYEPYFEYYNPFITLH